MLKNAFLAALLIVSLIVNVVLFLFPYKWENDHYPPNLSSTVLSPNQKNEGEGHSDSSKNKTPKIREAESADDRIARYTLWLAILTGGLVAVSTFQGYFLIRADKTARTAADTAKEAADTAFAAERARFFVVIDDHDLTYLTRAVESQAKPDGMTIPGGNLNIKYRFRNYGKTPGTIKEVAVDSMIATDPVEPRFILAINDYRENMIGPQDSTAQRTHNPLAPPIAGQLRAVRNNQARVWFFGRLYYDDVFGKHQVHRFYFRSVWFWDENGGSCILQPYDYKEHNRST